MAKQKRKKCTPLEVHIMFEPTRLEHACVQEAYAWLVPCARRRLSTDMKCQQIRSEAETQQNERTTQ